jgi:hypothetical protein
MIYGCYRDEYNIYVIEESKEKDASYDLVLIGFDGNREVIYTEYNKDYQFKYLYIDSSVVYILSGRKVLRYYAPEHIVDLIYETSFDNILFLPISTTDIYCDNIDDFSMYQPPPGLVIDDVFFSSLTNKTYSLTTGRGAFQWSTLNGFFIYYLGIDLRMEGITNFDVYKKIYIVPRGETAESLANYNVYRFTFCNQYLKERAKDLVLMGIDPHEISTCRYPEDDMKKEKGVL